MDLDRYRKFDPKAPPSKTGMPLQSGESFPDQGTIITAGEYNSEPIYITGPATQRTIWWQRGEKWDSLILRKGR